MALMVTSSDRVDTPGPALMQAPQELPSTTAPTASKAASQPCSSAWRRTSSLPHCTKNRTPAGTRRPSAAAALTTS